MAKSPCKKDRHGQSTLVWRTEMEIYKKRKKEKKEGRKFSTLLRRIPNLYRVVKHKRMACL